MKTDAENVEQIAGDLYLVHKTTGEYLEGSLLNSLLNFISDAEKEGSPLKLSDKVLGYLKEAESRYQKKLDEEVRVLDEQEEDNLVAEKALEDAKQTASALKKSNEKLEIQKEALEATNEKQNKFILAQEKEGRIYNIILFMVAVTFLVIFIFAVKMITVPTPETSKDFKEISLLVLGTALGAVAGFTAVNSMQKRPDCDKVETEE